MSLPDQTPKLPKLPFIIGDVVLLGAAWYIASREAGPLGVQAMAAVTACVILAAIIGAIPFLTDYARKQDESLDERQRGLEALARTINTAAEQISIAANGLNELTDLTHKNLKHAEQLPHKLQDKIAEFNAQLDNARENDREELEKELAELRSSDTDRLQAVADKVHKTIGELSRLETTTTQDFNARAEHVQKAQAAFTKSQDEAVAALRQAYIALTSDLAAAQSRAVAEIDRKLAERTATAISAIESAGMSLPAGPKYFVDAPVANTPPAGNETSAPANTPTDAASDVAAPPRRPRKSRREETSADVPATSAQQATTTSTSVDAPVTESAPMPPPFVEPPPIPAEKIVEVEPVAPASAEPFPVKIPAVQSPTIDSAAETVAHGHAPTNGNTSAAAPGSSSLAEPVTRKRASRKSNVEPEAELQLISEETPGADDTPFTSAEMMEQVISSDGATRLIATSYIGIGNRLFIRGEGPGLSWEKGIPLQFVSIGKWRWETPDASAAVRFKLYKNDEVECPGLGTLELEPGHQQEVIAKF
jgi:hypothetical protein